MRKAKKKQETPVPQAEQTAEVVAAPVQEEAPAVESAPKHRGRKAKAEGAEDAPKRLRREKPTLTVRKRARKEELPEKAEESIVLQYGGQELDIAQLKERVIETYVEAGHRRGRISKLNLYIKPEDQKVYYVINEKISGSIEF